MQMQIAIDHFQHYLTIQRGCAVGTVKGYATDLRLFQDYLLDNNCSLEIDEIEEKHILGFLSYISTPQSYKLPNSVITRARKLSSIRSFFTFLRKRKILLNNPSEFIEVPSLPDREPEYLSIDEFQKA